MVSFKFGRALLCALFSLTLAASCGPGECPEGEVCQTDGGDCPLTGCVSTDGGDNIPRAYTNMLVEAPVELTVHATYYLPPETEEALDGNVRNMCTQFAQTWVKDVQVTVGQKVSIQAPLGYYRDASRNPTRGVTCPGIYKLEARNVPDGWVCGFYAFTCTEDGVEQPVDFINGFRCAHDVRGHFLEAREDPELPPWNYEVETYVGGDGLSVLDVQGGDGTIGDLDMNILTLENGFVSSDHNTITFTPGGTARILTRNQTAP